MFETTFVYFDNIRAEVIRKVTIDGHEVAWVKSTKLKSTDGSGEKEEWFEYRLWCDCDLRAVSGALSVIGDDNDPYQCKYKFAACELRRREIRKELKGIPEFDWFPGSRNRTLKTLILELFERSQNHEWLGTFHDELHGYDLVRMLGVDYLELWTATNSLEREGKLGSSGGSLQPYNSKRKRDKPIFPYKKERWDSTFLVKVFSPISGYEPLEWHIEVFKFGRRIYTDSLPIKHEPEWTVGGMKFHDADVARLQVRLADLQDEIWEDERKGKFNHIKSRRKLPDD